jgi:uridine kinase
MGAMDLTRIGTMASVCAQAILVAGPSGAGKTRLATRVGLPTLQLDDFYKEGDDPTLPRLPTGEVDWDHPDSWSAQDATRAVHELCDKGAADIPAYDISKNARVGHRRLSLDGAAYFVAEGLFAAELAPGCLADGTAAIAVCVRRSRWVTFVLRLVRDLRERRKPALFLIRRGILLARREPDIVAALVAKGCQPMTPREAEAFIRELTGGTA